MQFTYADEADGVKAACATSLGVVAGDLDIQRFPAGVSNRVYLLSDSSGPQYVAKIFTKRSLEQVKEIEGHVSNLRKLGIHIPETLSISLFQDALPLHISRFQKGEHLSDAYLSQAAHLMAEVHQKGFLMNPAPKEKYKNDDHYRALFKKCKEWECAAILEEIYNELDLDYLKEIPRGVIHGDFSYSNLIIREDNQLSLIDFDHICTSYLLTDVVRCHMFYGFDESGSLQEDKVLDFALCYDAYRPLHCAEKANFYTHMKLMMIDTALEMYNHMYLIHDLAEETVKSPENATLVPELLVEKIKNLRHKKAIELVERNTPIIFFGLSGAGKTTLIHKLAKAHPELFYIPVFTVTRAAREDDIPEEFAYVTVDEFFTLERQNAFILTMHEGDRHYGYSLADVLDKARHPLMNCSAVGLESAKALAGIHVLILGDFEKGLQNRNNPEELAKRMVVNERLYENIFSKEWFLNAMDIIHINEWEKEEESYLRLEESILNRLDIHDDCRSAA